MTIMCCVCNKTRINNQWLPVISEMSEDERISHSYCPSCLHNVLTELEAIGRLAAGTAAGRQPAASAVSFI